MGTGRTAAERVRLRDDLLRQLPWDTPCDEIDYAFASELAAAPGSVAEQVTSWLRRVQVPVAGVLLVTAVLQVLAGG